MASIQISIQRVSDSIPTAASNGNQEYKTW